MNRYFYVLIFGVILSSSCSNHSTDPIRVELDFGQSVKKLLDSQIYKKKQARQSDLASKTPELDGTAADNAIRAYRTDN